jgi:hypothetical protein
MSIDERISDAPDRETAKWDERIDNEIDRDLAEIAKDTKEIEHLEEEKRRHHHHELFEIIVDGTAHEWPKGKITFAQVVTLEFPDYSEQSGINYSVKYTKGPKENPEGVLAPGASVEVKEGMNFHVSRTGQS